MIAVKKSSLVKLTCFILMSSSAIAEDTVYSTNQESSGTSIIYQSSSHFSPRTVTVNNGVILSSIGGSGTGNTVVNIRDSVVSLANNGTIQGDYYVLYVGTLGTLDSLVNSGAITQLVGGAASSASITNWGTITTLTNLGTISSQTSSAIDNMGTIGTLYNSSLIQGLTYGL